MPKIADLWAVLMTDVLGYGRLGTHGGDIGAGVTTPFGARHTESVVGVHVVRDGGWGEEDYAYSERQSTKSQTLAYGPTDSPAGLAAWS